MFYFLVLTGALLFSAHVVLLLISFRPVGFSTRRYFYSHAALWLTGLLMYSLAWAYHGQHRSGFLDYFNTGQRLLTILLFTAALSFVAHLIVRHIILPLWQRK